MTIASSVGKAGINRPNDVKVVQHLLNSQITKLFPLKKLAEDGDCGAKTIEAILLFQKKVVKLSLPDGRVDPGGKTWKALTGASSFEKLPTSSDYYSYKEVNSQYGTPATLASIAAAAKSAKSTIKVQLGIGHLSLEKGGAFGGHTSHQKGVDVDIRPLREDGAKLPTNISDSNYSSEKTAKLVAILQKDSNLDLILFNDTAIKGVKKWDGHDDHLHVRFKS